MRVTRDLRRRLWCAELCLPRLALRPPAGPGWIHEIEHDGFRILEKQNAAGVHLFTRKGYDLSVRFPLATTAVAALPARSCLIDGEAIARDQNGLAVFEMIRWRRHDQDVASAPSICLSSTPGSAQGTDRGAQANACKVVAPIAGRYHFQ
jgi:hypothetical protein